MNGSGFAFEIDKKHVRFNFITIGFPGDCPKIHQCLSANHKFIMGARYNLFPEKIVTLGEGGFLSVGYLSICVAIKLLSSVVSVKRSNKDRPRSGRLPCSTPARNRCVLVKVVQNWTVNNHRPMCKAISSDELRVSIGKCDGSCSHGDRAQSGNYSHLLWVFQNFKSFTSGRPIPTREDLLYLLMWGKCYLEQWCFLYYRRSN